MTTESISISYFNHINIVLIPKGHVQASLVDFRSISLCNSIYKCFSEMLSNRLKIVLPGLVSPYQCAFLKGRSATDNNSIGLEIFQQIFESNSQNIALKINLSKAFHKIEWNLILYILQCMNFPLLFTHWIFSYISSSKIAIRFNQQRTHYFTPF